MAPSASMLFLSYHQLHRPAVEVPKEENNGVRLSLSNIFSPGVFARRREAAAGGKRGCEAGGEEAAALESKFEEALRHSCWSS